MVVTRGPQLDWFGGPTLLERLETLDCAAEEATLGAFRFPVQLVSRPQADSARSYLGRIESGRVALGDEVLLLPAGRRTRVREIVVQGLARPVAAAGDSVSLVLADDIDVARGDLIVDPRSAPRETRLLEATLVWLDADPMHTAARYLVQQAGRRSLARIKEVTSRRDVHTLEERAAEGSIAMNDIVQAKLALQSPLFVDRYDALRATGAFILIDEATNRTVAAGMVQ
jgi:sulfate adenylyltransferase subunit 1